MGTFSSQFKSPPSESARAAPAIPLPAASASSRASETRTGLIDTTSTSADAVWTFDQPRPWGPTCRTGSHDRPVIPPAAGEPRRGGPGIPGFVRRRRAVGSAGNPNARSVRMRRISALGLAAASLWCTAGTADAASAPPGYTIVRTADLPSPPGTQTRGVATCPPGAGPLSGGVVIAGSAIDDNVNSTFPQGTSWVADVNNATSDSTTFSVIAVCAAQPKRYRVVETPEA